MKKKILICVVGFMLLLQGCGVPQEEYDNLSSGYTVLKNENESLENQIQQLQEELAKIKKEYKEYKERTEREIAEYQKEETETTEMITESDLPEESSGNSEEQSETESMEETVGLVKTWDVKELEINGELITESTATEMAKGYDYIKDVYIEVDDSKKEIGIVVQISSLVDKDIAKMAGEDVARYFAAQASLATNSYHDYKTPGADDLGSLYDRYNLLIYVDDGNHNFDIYGAKVTTAKKITWR